MINSHLAQIQEYYCCISPGRAHYAYGRLRQRLRNAKGKANANSASKTAPLQFNQVGARSCACPDLR